MGQLVFQATAGGQVALVGPNPSSNFSLNIPAVNGNLVTTGDTGTVTNTMLASSAYTAPGTIGSGTPNSGAFTTLSASSTVSGTGFSTYLASPPAIGGTTPSTGKFTSITNTGLTATQVIYATTGGLETSSANMTFNGTSLTLANDASISGLTVGKGGGAVSSNTTFGVGSLGNNTSGNQNTAIGWNSSPTMTTGAGNTSLGYASLYLTSTGNSNTAIGVNALNNNTTASNNTAVGYQAGYSNTTGNITAFGFQAGYTNSTASSNTAIGYQALYNNNTGNNTAVGYQAMTTNTTGGSNSGFGVQALSANTSGSSNAAFGYASLYNNTTGNYNSAFGSYSGGVGTLFNNTTGSNNTAFGFNCGNNITTGSSNTYLGAYVSASSASVNNEIVIAAGTVTGKGTNTGFINAGNGGVYQGNNSAAWSITSDQRLKKNIVDNTVGLSAINAIQVRNFEYRTADEVTDLPKEQAIDIQGIQLGAIAQELALVLPDCVKTESTGVMSVDTTNITWHLINAVKELSAEVTALKAKLGA